MQLTNGTLLQGGKYKIESMLGQGAYGITYLATTKVKGPLGDIAVKVAIKEFFSKELNTRKVDGNVSEVSSDSLAGKYSNMFLREARNLSHLKHEGIVNVLEAFSENNTHYYVMEYVDAGSLDSYIRSKGRLSERETLSLARQIGSALAFMHDNKMLHLDLKPKNIMLRADGTLCLIDFGLSKQYQSDGEPESSTTIGLGTPGYAPIEQGSSDDRKTFAPTLDIYAFGATLYKMLIGKTPPRASDIFNEGFPGEELLSLEISEETISAIRHAMSPRKVDRPQSVEEFLLLLNEHEPVSKEVDKDDSEDRELEGKEPEDTMIVGSVHIPRDDKRRVKKLPWPLLAVAAVAVALIVILSRPEPDGLRSDLWHYNALVYSGDSLSYSHQYSEAKAFYDSAATYGSKYSFTRYSSRFRPSAKAKSSEIQTKIDSIILADSLAERKRNKSQYKYGLLRVKGVEYPMVYVSGGSFEMGATAELRWYRQSDEEPVHSVTLSSYRIGKYEVTQELWEAVMGSNPSSSKGSRSPVENVSWNDCQRFINKLNELTGQNFRLPTEAEWEFAARGGNSSRGYKYSGSDVLSRVARYDSYGGPSDVGGLSPNELGIYDMSGNVGEWCSDWYGVYGSESLTNPKGSDHGSERVYRGGDYFHDSISCRLSDRASRTPDSGTIYLGLRLCL